MSTFTPQSKSAAPSFTAQSKTLLTYYLLLENGSFLLLENLGKIILDQSGFTTPWTAQIKSS